MNKQQQNLIWSLIPVYLRESIKKVHTDLRTKASELKGKKSMEAIPLITESFGMERIVGLHNLISDIDKTFSPDKLSPVDPRDELNLPEILKGHEGEPFFSYSHGPVIFTRIIDSPIGYNIELKAGEVGSQTIVSVLSDGKRFKSGEMDLWPSKEFYLKYHTNGARAWKLWKLKREVDSYVDGCTSEDDIDDTSYSIADECIRKGLKLSLDYSPEEIKMLLNEKENQTGKSVG